MLYNAGAAGGVGGHGTRNVQTKDESDNDKSHRNIVRAHKAEGTDGRKEESE